MIDSDILEFYNRGLEQTRLKDPRKSVQFWRYRDILARHLPDSPATILDVGGGPATYALPLAEEGYDVTLIDPVPLHVSQATEAFEKHTWASCKALCGDARDLPVDGEYDAALLLGPMYHLVRADDRLQAWREARRCVRPGGVIITAAVSRFYLGWATLAANKLRMPGVAEATDKQLRSGEYHNPGDDERLWTTAYFHTPDELANEVRTAGLTLRALVGVEGPAKLLGDIGERMVDPQRRQQIIDTQRRIEEEPSVLGMSQHIIAIAECSKDQ
ncbi:methyltransferase domain-containing protein [Streptomyces sp. NPDC007084]|uniref:class I SAM-dependent methyltransferase n=1 Tax=Streptomyces sp. NPDC007084 TaxID=3154313 RepID=UPI003454F06C